MSGVPYFAMLLVAASFLVLGSSVFLQCLAASVSNLIDPVQGVSQGATLLLMLISSRGRFCSPVLMMVLLAVSLHVGRNSGVPFSFLVPLAFILLFVFLAAVVLAGTRYGILVILSFRVALISFVFVLASVILASIKSGRMGVSAVQPVMIRAIDLVEVSMVSLFELAANEKYVAAP